MAHGKDPSSQSEREKSDETQRDSDSASEHQADFDRDAERVEADRAKLQVEATQTLLVILGERMWPEAAQNARLKEMKGCD